MVTATSPQEPAFRGTFVAQDGKTTKVGRFTGQWDLDAERDSVVARFGDYYEVRDVTTGEVTRRSPPSRARTARSATRRSAATTSSPAGATRARTSSWSASTSTPAGSTTSRPRGCLNYTTSVDGLHVVGEQFRSQEVSGPTCLAGGPVDAFDENGWETCDWRSNGFLPQFSPSGTQLLTVPYDTEGFGPSSFGILDVANGRVRNEFDVPELVTDARVGGQRHALPPRVRRRRPAGAG